MKKHKIVVVDYGIGNVKSINNAFISVGAEVALSREEDEILNANGLVLPGVGAFAHAMERLEYYNLSGVIKEYVDKGKPLLGICLGMQLLFTESEEFGLTRGLDIIPGRVIKFPFPDDLNVKLPHIGWNELNEPAVGLWNNTIFNSLDNGKEVYFVHSFICVPDNNNFVLSLTKYSDFKFCSSVKKDNVFGCQFHPEKSSNSGLKILKNYMDLVWRENG